MKKQKKKKDKSSNNSFKGFAGKVRLYTQSFANAISGGAFVNRDSISSAGIKISYDRIHTKKYEKRIWVINSFPVTFSTNFTTVVRVLMTSKCPNVRTIVRVHAEPIFVNPNTEVFKNSMARAGESYEEVSYYQEGLREDQKLVGTKVRLANGRVTRFTKRDVERIKNNYQSYLYITKAYQEGQKFYKSSVFIEAYFKDRKDVRNYTRELNSVLMTYGVNAKAVKGNLTTFLENYGITSYREEKLRNISTMLLTDQNLGYLSSFRRQGLVGDKGILLGMDVATKYPFSLNLFESAAAQVCMVLGKSGHGKSFLMFIVSIFLIADDIHCSVIDIKGHEWLKTLKYVQGEVISMNGFEPMYVNTLRLDDIPINSIKEAQEAYSDAIEATQMLFQIMVGKENPEQKKDLNAILRTAIEKVYSKAGVTWKNPRTFSKTKDLTFADVLISIRRLEASKTYTESMRQSIQDTIVRCSKYVEGNGPLSATFAKELTVQDILDTPMVIYSFDKNSKAAINELDALRLFMVQFLDSKKFSIRAKKQLFTAAIYEELQRCKEFGELTKYISHVVTGSRSSNVIVFLLLNSLSTFEETELKHVKSNITTKIIGKLDSTDIEILCKEHDCAPYRDLLYKVGGPTPVYDNSFAVCYDTGKTTDALIIKALVKPDMIETLNTRTVRS